MAGHRAAGRVRDHGTAEKIVNDSPYAQAGMYEQTEIHNWRFGGRPQPDPATS